MEKKVFNVEEGQLFFRLDKFLLEKLTDVSRSQIQAWVKDGHVLVNGSPSKVNHKVKLTDTIEVAIPEVVELELLPEAIPLDVYYEDDDVIVINKPKGMVVHPAAGHQSGTLVNALLHHCKGSLSGINGVARPGIVHRIDKDTSGLLMVAKNDEAHQSLVWQLQNKTVTRKYIALVHGNIPHEKGTIDAPIGRDPQDRQKMTVIDENAREAVTHFNVLEHFGDDYTLIECILETGRTHQIRVHMKYIGFPLVGDPKYGQRKTLDIGGQALHAAILGFNHPKTNVYIERTAPLPKDFQKLIEKLRVTP